jgi:hypothetical protein
MRTFCWVALRVISCSSAAYGGRQLRALYMEQANYVFYELVMCTAPFRGIQHID